MDEPQEHRILIAGAGIAGLTAALAFAAHGFQVAIFERAEKLEEVGAGLQLSPNATRILRRLGVLDRLLPVATRPEAVVLRDAASLRELARVPLGKAAEARWGAPYLVLHRADLQNALLAGISGRENIRLMTGAFVRGATLHQTGVTVSIGGNGAAAEAQGALLVGADGVWSTIRPLVSGARGSRPSGKTAWRITIGRDSAAWANLAALTAVDAVTAFLHPAFHLVAYPVAAGAAVNLVVLTSSGETDGSWAERPDPTPLAGIMAKAAPPLAALARTAGPWIAWPIHAVDPAGRWSDPRGLALIGDAAHAMTPFAAQGAAMAIEDAAVLADLVAALPGDLPRALARYEALRRPRTLRVARRGAFNHFAWHARGPVALARNAVLKVRPAEKLAADLDWLYGWDAEEQPDLTTGVL